MRADRGVFKATLGGVTPLPSKLPRRAVADEKNPPPPPPLLSTASLDAPRSRFSDEVWTHKKALYFGGPGIPGGGGVLVLCIVVASGLGRTRLLLASRVSHLTIDY